MMVAGRLIPYLGVGYIAYEMAPDSLKKELYEEPILGQHSLRDRVEGHIDLGVQIYTRAKLGYALGSNLLEAFSS